jgi:catechol 2,3-dioxygenase
LTKGVLGVHSIDHFALTVPDLEAAEAFYRRFGLETRAAGNELELYASGGPHRWGRLRESPRKALDYLSFGAYAEDLPAFRDRLRARGVAEVAPPANAADESGIWFRDDDGMTIEIRAAAKVSPDRKAPAEHPAAPGGTASAPLRSNVAVARPRRLSHVLVFTSDVARAVDFYRDTLGLRLSDAAGDIVAFMHGVHGSDHHLVAFAKSDAGGYHHSSWDVPSVDEIGRGAMQMADAGHVAGWGLGRHVLGSNYFHYVRDPWGSYAEYAHDIDYIPADAAWQPGHVTPDNGFYLWGPMPPEDFAYNYESPSAAAQRDLIGSRNA